MSELTRWAGWLGVALVALGCSPERQSNPGGSPSGARGTEAGAGGAESAMGGAESAMGGVESAMGGVESAMGGVESAMGGAESAMGGAAGETNDAGTGGMPEPGPIVANESCVSPSPEFSSNEERLVALPAGSWFEVPDSALESVCPTELNNCGNVVEPWSSGAFDPVGRRMLIFGGGHGDYAGNEVYAFLLETLTWQRLTEPSDPDFANQDPLPDGNPVSRHTYDGLSFITHAGRLFAHGGSRWQDGSGTDVSWTFDPATGTWEDRDPENAADPPYCCGESSAYDPKSALVYFHLIDSLAAYDFDANQWLELASYGNAPFWPRYESYGYKRGLVDTERDLLWFIGDGLLLVYDIGADEHVTDAWVMTGGEEFTNDEHVGDREEQLITTGGAEVLTAPAPGADYDTAADDIVAWVGGAPWVLDLESKHWSRTAAEGGPEAPSSAGTYGRFRYIPRVNAYILVNGSGDNVWFYKHTAGCGEPP